MLLPQKNIVIIGCTTGIGLSAAPAFVREGAKRMLVSRNKDSCKRVKVLLNDAVLVYSADAVNPTAFIQVTDHCLRQFGGFVDRPITVIQGKY